MDFRLGFSFLGFYVLYIILSGFLTKDVLECVVNPTYWIRYCDCTLNNLVLKTPSRLYCYSVQPTRWDVTKIGTAWGDINYGAISRIAVHGRHYIIRHFCLERDVLITTFVLFYFHSVSLCFLVFTLCNFCIPRKHSSLNVFPF